MLPFVPSMSGSSRWRRKRFRIAVVGKGDSGKSTITGIVTHIQGGSNRHVLAVLIP